MQRYIVPVILLILVTVFQHPLAAQEASKGIVTAEFEVTGVCKMCKERIEKAALIKGVRLAEWDKDTQILKVMYKAGKVETEDIKKSVAAAGHDTDTVKATDEAYSKLPGCCAYRDGVGVH